LKTLALFLLFINFGLKGNAQNFQLKITGSSTFESKTIDSLNHNTAHKNTKSIQDEITSVSEKLSKIGFIENKILENKKTNDSTYITKFSLGERIKSIHIYIGRKTLANTHFKGEGEENIKEIIAIDKNKDSIIIPYIEIEPFLNETLLKLEKKGFALAKLKLINIHKHKNSLFADLQFEASLKRTLNSIVVKFSKDDKKNTFPEGHLAQINRKYHNSTFNKNIVNQIHDDFEKFGFVNQVKYPEILFTKDTTKVYVYLEKRKSNTFEGFIGFTNSKTNKLAFNGYLDLALENTLGVGEQFSLYWKSDGNNQKTFKAGIEIPYLFKSPIGIKAELYIFKKDSLFQNTKTAINIGYLINYNTRVYLGYQSTESSDIQNTNSKTLSDYKNSFLTINLEYSKQDYTNPSFGKKSKLSLTIGSGKRTTDDLIETAGKSTQLYINFQAMNTFYLNKKNAININYHNYFLQSENYVVNELFRFGGINSIRGFAENSLQANLFSALLTEYRYIVSPNLYINTITDYGHYQDKSTGNSGNLFSLGIGIGIQTKNGLLKLAFVNGSADLNELKFYNTIATINYNIKF
jgi:hypothetical protein